MTTALIDTDTALELARRADGYLAPSNDPAIDRLLRSGLVTTIPLGDYLIARAVHIAPTLYRHSKRSEKGRWLRACEAGAVVA